MFGRMRRRLRKKDFKNWEEKRENWVDFWEESLKKGLAGLEKLLSEEAKLKQMADEKRREIARGIKLLEEKLSLLGGQLGRVRLQFRDLFETKEMKEEKMEIEKVEAEEGLFSEGKELGDVEHGEENIVKSEQENLALRLQSKEEENKSLKIQIKEMEEEFRIKNEKREQEIEELRKRLQETFEG